MLNKYREHIFVENIKTDLLAVLLFLYGALFYDAVFALAPTAEQIRQSQSLSPQQQESLKQSLKSAPRLRPRISE